MEKEACGTLLPPVSGIARMTPGSCIRAGSPVVVEPAICRSRRSPRGDDGAVQAREVDRGV